MARNKGDHDNRDHSQEEPVGQGAEHVGAGSRPLPSLPVTPDTLPRWHREAARRTARQRDDNKAVPDHHLATRSSG
jgi:hypothetical protein